MTLERHESLVSLAVLVMAMSCGDDGNTPRHDAGAPDGGGATDGGTSDAGTNPSKLWLAPINGSETNLKLADREPPPF